jgi:hypothetical protein
MRAVVIVHSVLLIFCGMLFCLADRTHVLAQDAADHVESLIQELNALEKTFQNYSADILFEDRLIELKGRVEYLKGSFIFVGQYRNLSSSLAPSTDWAAIEFGVFGNASQTHYPERKLCRIYKDAPDQVPGQFSMNPALLFSQRHTSRGLASLLAMRGEASFGETQSTTRTAVVKRFPSLIESAGDRAAVHEIEFIKDANSMLIENSLRGGARGDLRDFLIWKQSAEGLWYPHEQKCYWWPRGAAKESTHETPHLFCRLDSLTISLREFQYLPANLESRLPFATKIERYPSKFGTQEDGSVEISYAGGDEGELQHNLDLLIEGFKLQLEAGTR